MRMSLVAAPLISAFQGIVSLFLLFSLPLLVPSEHQATLFVFLTASFLTALYINITACFYMGGVVGDYAAFRLLKKNSMDFLIILYNDYLVQNRCTKEKMRKEDSYMFRESVRHLKRMMPDENGFYLQVKTARLLNIVLRESFFMQVKESEKDINDIVESALMNLKVIQERLLSELYMQLFCNIVMYLFLHNNAERAYALWDENKNKIPDTKRRKYLTGQVEMLLFGAQMNDGRFKNGVQHEAGSKIFSHMRNYNEDEQRLNEMWILRNSGGCSCIDSGTVSKNGSRN